MKARFVSFSQVSGGNSSLNFRARSKGGEAVLVKFAKPSRLKKAVGILRKLQTPLVPRVVMDVQVTNDRDYDVCAIAWAEGKTQDAADLDERQAGFIVQAYKELAQAMQNVRGDLQGAEAIAGFKTVAIHGDLNWRNILYKEDGSVDAFLDFEQMRLGLATEDLLRIPLHAMERTRFWRRKRLRRLEGVLSAIIKASQYSKEEWLAALEAYIERKKARRTKKSSFAFAKEAESFLRLPMYVRIRRLILEACEASENSVWNRLVATSKLEEIGRGTRRAAYKVGDSGYCAKFYRTPEDCRTSQKMKPSIKRDIKLRRFDYRRNSSSQEVAVAETMRKTMPREITDRLPAICQRVFHPSWGWGVIENFYTNPDGTAIIPYEYELRRQMHNPAVRKEIYIQARELLCALIRESATFYEPGNFHVLFNEDGNLEMKLIDFEPDAKTLIPLEKIWPLFRRCKLVRKARRYLASMREKYKIDVEPATEIG